MKLRLLAVAAVSAIPLTSAPAVAGPAGTDWNGRCAAKEVPFSVSGSGQVLVGPEQPVDRDTLLINGPEAYKVEGGTVTITMQKTTFVIAPGTFFRPECFGAYRAGPYPSVKLYVGQIRVTGTAESPKQTGVRTWEAVAHTLSAHSFAYTVSRKAKTPADGDAARGRVTVSVQRGGPIMLSPRKGLKKKWPCKTGQTFTVDWLGRVTHGR